MRRLRWLPVAVAVALLDLLPVALIVKQAVTPERESFAWPPTWVPQNLTLDNFRAVRDTVELAYGFGLSAFVAVLTVVSTFVITAPAAWAAARSARTDRPLDTLMVVVRLFPVLVLAIPMASIFVHLHLYNQPAGLGLWLAHTLLAIPVAFLVLRDGFRRVPVEIEEAALLDGATPVGVLWRITLPLARPALGAAAILVFLISWDEFAYALLLQVTNRPLPPLLFYLAAFGHPGLASALAAIMMVPAICVIVLLEPALRSGALTGSGR